MFSNRIRNAIELTSGTNSCAPRIQRQVNRSTSMDAAAPTASAPAAASGHGMPWWMNHHVAMPPSMNRPGILKLRNLNTPMDSVSATPTIA